MKFSTAAIAVAAVAGVSAQGYNTTVVVTATSEAVLQSTDVVTITSCTGSNVVSCHYVTSTPVPANASTSAAEESSVAPVAPTSNFTASSNISTPVATTVAEATGAAAILSGSVFGAIAVAGVALLL